MPVWILLSVLISYIALGAAVFATYQGWTYVDSLFFSFAVLGTIGLIDIPTSTSSSITDSSSPSFNINKQDEQAPSKTQMDYSIRADDVLNQRREANSVIFSESATHHQMVDSFFVVLCTCYLLLGLAIISMCVQLMEDTCRNALRKLATTRLMGGSGSWMFSVYGGEGGYHGHKRINKGRYWTTSGANSPNNSSSWQGGFSPKQNSRETSIDNLPHHLGDMSISRSNHHSTPVASAGGGGSTGLYYHIGRLKYNFIYDKKDHKHEENCIQW